MLIGDIEITEPPFGDLEAFMDWYECEFAAAGAALLEDPRAVDMGFGDRPLTNMEMEAARAASSSWQALAAAWIRGFDEMLQRKCDDLE